MFAFQFKPVYYVSEDFLDSIDFAIGVFMISKLFL